eukprot:5818432-Pleurochrysis_carterae.AAC.2
MVCVPGGEQHLCACVCAWLRPRSFLPYLNSRLPFYRICVLYLQVELAEKNPKQISKWITSINDLHRRRNDVSLSMTILRLSHFTICEDAASSRCIEYDGEDLLGALAAHVCRTPRCTQSQRHARARAHAHTGSQVRAHAYALTHAQAYATGTNASARERHAPLA